MFARFDENPAMTLQDIKETKRYGQTDGRKDGRTHARTDNVKTVYPPQTKFAGGYNNQEGKPYGRTDGRTHTRTDGQRENSIPTTNKVCGGYNNQEGKPYLSEAICSGSALFV